MRFRHLVLGFVSTTLVASTVSVQAATPAKPAAPSKASTNAPSTVKTSTNRTSTSVPSTVKTSTSKTSNSVTSTSKTSTGATSTVKTGTSVTSTVKTGTTTASTNAPGAPVTPKGAYTYSTPSAGRTRSADPYSTGVSSTVLAALTQAARLKTSKDPRRAERILLNALSQASTPAKVDEKPDTTVVKKDGTVEEVETAETTVAAEKQAPVDTALPLLALAKFYRDQKKPQDALTYAQKLLDVDKTRFKNDSLFVAEDLNLIAELQASTGNYEGAISTYQQALEITKKASSSQYSADPRARDRNKARKTRLVLALNDGLAQAKFHPVEDDDGTAAEAADAYFSSSIKEILSSPDNIGKYDRANILFTRYKQYLKSSDQTDKATKADDQIEDFERKIQADRMYRAPVN